MTFLALTTSLLPYLLWDRVWFQYSACIISGTTIILVNPAQAHFSAFRCSFLCYQVQSTLTLNYNVYVTLSLHLQRPYPFQHICDFCFQSSMKALTPLLDSGSKARTFRIPSLLQTSDQTPLG